MQLYQSLIARALFKASLLSARRGVREPLLGAFHHTSPKHSRPTDQQTTSHLWNAKYVILCNVSTEMPSISPFLNQAIIVAPQKATLRLNASCTDKELQSRVLCDIKTSPSFLFSAQSNPIMTKAVRTE